MSKLARVYIEGGLVTDVLNLPKSWSYKIIDYDTDTDEKCCGNCEKASICEVEEDEEGCVFELNHKAQKLLDKQKKEEQEFEQKIRNKVKELMDSGDEHAISGTLFQYLKLADATKEIRRNKIIIEQR